MLLGRKIKVYLIRKDKTLQIKKFAIKDGKVIVQRRKYEVPFKPEHIILKERRFLKIFPRSPEPCLIIQEGKNEPETPKRGKWFVPFTEEELRVLIKRLIGEALTQVKPIKLNQFIILVLFNVIILVLLLMQMSGVRIG